MKNGFMQDGQGNFSSVRLTYFVSMAVAIVVTFTTKDMAMASLWIGAATASKMVSKIIEK